MRADVLGVAWDVWLPLAWSSGLPVGVPLFSPVVGVPLFNPVATESSSPGGVFVASKDGEPSALRSQIHVLNSEIESFVCGTTYRDICQVCARFF